MAKAPEKSQPNLQKATCPGPAMGSKSSRPYQYGGKNLKNLTKLVMKKRQLSLTESTCSDSSDSARRSKTATNSHALSSVSVSSFKALSDQEEVPQTKRTGERISLKIASKGRARYSKATKGRPAKSTKSVRSSAKAAYYQNLEVSDDAVLSDDDNESDEENFVVGLYSMIGNKDKNGNSSGSETSDDWQDNKNDSSSSEDSVVNFTNVQTEQQKNNLKAIKGLPVNSAHTKTKAQKRCKSTNIRKRSEVNLPEDINFQFDFEQSRRMSVFDESGEETKTSSKGVTEAKEEEEDIGEEVQDTNNRPEFDFHFDQPLIDVPKIKDDEFNSDNDYEFDDNDLLATLQAENDIDEFLPFRPTDGVRTRQSSMSSVNDDADDAFLGEEEKFLVNEFETNGFDDEGAANNETARPVDSFNLSGVNDQVIKYASAAEDDDPRSDFEEFKLEFDDDENEVGKYMDIIDVDAPAFEPGKERTAAGTRKKERRAPSSKKRGNRWGPIDSEEEDESYLWNYFLSSDADSDADDTELRQYDVEEQFLLEEVFRKDFEEKQKQSGRKTPIMGIQDSKFDAGYDSGESTDVDISLPSHGAGSKLGSELAKEVLSSHTADYRPPVLGTWVAIDSKPFSIIDGLSTRTLMSHNQQRNPRTKNWKGFSLEHDSEDLAIDLEELLNVSELDNDDENDVRIWREFTKNKKHVPLGAFRNKSKMHQPHLAEPLAAYNGTKMSASVTDRRSLRVNAKLAAQRELESHSNANLAKELNLPSKLKRRRASFSDAVSEGYCPTKAGLFSENVLADVEEVMGDERDFMELIRGL